MNLCGVLASHPENSRVCFYYVYKTARNKDRGISDEDQRSNPTLAINPKTFHVSLNFVSSKFPYKMTG